MNPAGRDALIAMLSRLKSDLQGVKNGRAETTRATLATKYPVAGDYLAEVQRLCLCGLEDGWLVAGPGGASLRLASPSKYFPFAIEAQVLAGPDPARRPGRGLILAWSLDDNARFCGQGSGWVTVPPGWGAPPEVTGGRMLLLHFVPGGGFARAASAGMGGASRAAAGRLARPPARADAVARSQGAGARD